MDGAEANGQHTVTSKNRVPKDQLLATIRADRERFDRIVARVPRERLPEPSLPGGWSVKDVLAHVAWGDREGIGVARARALVGSDLWNVSEDERNRTCPRMAAVARAL